MVSAAALQFKSTTAKIMVLIYTEHFSHEFQLSVPQCLCMGLLIIVHVMQNRNHMHISEQTTTNLWICFHNVPLFYANDFVHYFD